MKSPGLTRLSASVLMFLSAGAAARGEIAEFSAVLEARVQRITGQFPDGQAVTEVRVPDDVGTLPLEAIAFLTTPGMEEGMGGEGWAAVSFDDPLRTLPQELKMELVSYSQDPATSFISEGRVLERRKVVFTPQDTGRVLGERLTANSQLFLRGLIVFWAPGADDDLTDLSAVVTAVVRQIPPGGEPSVVLDAAAIVDGGPGGQITVDADGAILPEALLPIDLTGALPDVGVLHVVGIPHMVLPYTYPVVVGQEFELQVEVTAEVAGLTDARGAALVLGRPFQNFAAIVDEILRTDLGTRMQNLSNDRAAALAQVPPLPAVALALLPACASMGVEIFGLALLTGVLCAVGTRRGRLL